VSRVDNKVDAAIEAAVKALPEDDSRRAELNAFRGKAAIANARLAYERFEREFSAPRFDALKGRGARVQRPLWASTSTKNPAYPDTMYIDELIGRDTVNTVPPKTLIAFDDHGTAEESIHRDLDGARTLFRRLPELGIPLEAKIAELEPEGVAAFTKSYETLLATLEEKHKALAARR
jgi:transaldolase